MMPVGLLLSLFIQILQQVCCLDIITTIAGNGISSYSMDNIAATSSALYSPYGIAIDVSGNVYIGDYSNNRIRKVTVSTGIISTVAGTGGTSNIIGDGGDATSASLYLPHGVAIDSSGNIYICDSYNHRIRKVTVSTNIISTLAGTGSSSFNGDGSDATSTTLSHPSGVVVDSAGDVYIADFNNHRIRKITVSTSIISTVAGTGTSSYSGDGGDATSATMKFPIGVALDSTGNIYIADRDNHRVRMVTVSTGIITTVAGSATGTSGSYSGDGGFATSASLYYPSGVGVDSSGNVYIADTTNNRIRKVTISTGIITTFVGTGASSYSGDNGDATSAEIKNARGIALDSSGHLYISDTSNHRIRKVISSDTYYPSVLPTLAPTGPSYSPTCKPTFLPTWYPFMIPTPSPSFSPTAKPSTPSPSTANPTLSPSSYYVISTAAGTGTASYSGDGSQGASAALNSPYGVVTDSAGNLYIADSSNHRIRKLTVSTGIISTIAGTGSDTYSGDGEDATSAALYAPYGVAVDTSGNLFIADCNNHRIRKVAVSTGYISTIAGTGSASYSGDDVDATSAALYYPYGLALDSSGNLYIADSNNHRVRKVTVSTGIISTIAGTGTGTYSGDGGSATSTALNYPRGVAIDSAGNVYIADSSNHRIRKITVSTGIISTFAGTGVGSYSGDGGAATSASLNSPYSVAIDASGNVFNVGNVYIADYSNSRIRKITISTGIISTFAGTGTKSYSGDGGDATSAALNYPSGVALDSAGVVYIADTSNSRIRKVTSSDTYYPTAVPTVTPSFVPTVTPSTSKPSTASPSYLGFISTIAGTGAFSYSGDNGAATSAELNAPFGVAVDSSDNVYIADTNNNRIRKVTVSTGIISTIAGTGTGSYSGDGGAATSAAFYNPRGVAVDSSGNVYIVDLFNHRIRKVTVSTGIISTIAGTGTGSYSGDGGAATSAGLYYPSDVAVDTSDDVYIADTYNHRIRKITASTGIMSTIAGTGTGSYSGDDGAATSAALSNPFGVTVDTSDNVYIADNYRIRKITASTGIISTIAGTGTYSYSGDGGAATSATFYNPRGVAVDSSGNVYIADYSNHRIRKVTVSTGIITTIAGTGSGSYNGDGGAATSAALYYPNGVAVDTSGIVYIADANNSRIRKVASLVSHYPTEVPTVTPSTSKPSTAKPSFSPSTAPPTASPSVIYVISTKAGTGTGSYSGDSGTATSATLYNPFGVAIDSSGNIYIDDSGNHRIRKVTVSTGIITTIVGTGTSSYSGNSGIATSFALSSPSGVTLDSSGNVYIADRGNNRICKVTVSTGVISTIAGTISASYSGDNGAATSAALNSPHGVALDSSGNVYIADTTNNRIRRVMISTGIISTIAGSSTSGSYNGEGHATSATLNYPYGVALDSSGNVYIADYGNNRIRKWTTGTISTIAGTGSFGSSGDNGAATSATLTYPYGVAVDSSGNVYIADSSNNRIRKVTVSTGIISTIAGTGSASFSGDGGAATSAELSYPRGVALDSSGNVYIADTYNNRIRKVVSSVSSYPSVTPTYKPTVAPSTPSFPPTYKPTFSPTLSPSTSDPTIVPTSSPTTFNPTVEPSMPTPEPTYDPTMTPSISPEPSSDPSIAPSSPSLEPTYSPTVTLTLIPTLEPSYEPTVAPSSPSVEPTYSPTVTPILIPTPEPSYEPTITPTSIPTIEPTYIPTMTPTSPTFMPTKKPSYTPTFRPTKTPSYKPSFSPTYSPTYTPSVQPSSTYPSLSPNALFIITTIAGTGKYTSSTSSIGDGGDATSAGLAYPAGVALDSAGNFYIADVGNHRIRKVTVSTGIITTIAGTGVYTYSTSIGDNGPASSARISYPYGVTVDSAGNVYIADNGNCRIRKVTVSSGIIQTIAGTGSCSYSGDGGAATSAELYSPYAVALDSSDNVYIADYNNYRIRKVTVSTGIITTIAGTGSGSYSGDGEAATSAALHTAGVALDSSGNVYIADDINHRVRKVTVSTGIISTIAGTGTGTYSGDGGSATSTALNYPYGVAIDSAGNIYIADSGNYRIRKITISTGIISTIAGTGVGSYSGDNGAATSAALYNPYGVALDSSGNLYVADLSNYRIRKVALADTYGPSPSPTVAPTTATPSTAAPSFMPTESPTFIPSVMPTKVPTTIPTVTPTNTPSVIPTAIPTIVPTINPTFTPTYDPTFTPTVTPTDDPTVVPSVMPTEIPTETPTVIPTTTPTDIPTCIPTSIPTVIPTVTPTVIPTVSPTVIPTVTPSFSPTTYFPSLSPNTISTIDTIAGTGSTSFTGDGDTATSATLYSPYGIALDSAGNVYIGDSSNNRIRKMTVSTGIISTIAGTGSGSFSGDEGDATSATLWAPYGVAIDSSGNVYIADRTNHRIRVVTILTGLISTIAGTGTSSYSGDNGDATSAALKYPEGVALDVTGNVYIADSSNHRIRKVTVSTGIISTIAGSSTSGSFSGDGGQATAATLFSPYGVALDLSGNVYIDDRNNQRIRKVSLFTGIISTIAGTGSTGYSGDNGAATAALLNVPRGIAVDLAGNVYIADQNNHRIRKVAVSTGIISTVAGSRTSGGFSGDGGKATSAFLNSPQGVAVDSSGNVYIADSNNHRIRKVELSTGVIISSTPSSQPTSKPSGQPSRQPSSQPTGQPSRLPTSQPSVSPTSQPTSNPTQPTSQPSNQPTSQPSSRPSSHPTCPSSQPTSQPSSQPSTSLIEVVIFSVSMQYQNLDVNDWNADKIHHETLVKASFVQRVAGLRDEDIVDISAVDKSTRRLISTDETSTVEDQRKLITKGLELDITFNIRPQYFNRTESVSVSDVYNSVVSRVNSSSSNVLLDLQSSSSYFTNAVLVSTTYSSYSSMISRSSFPTSSPTSQPTCGTGSYQVGSGCGPCTQGYYTDSLNAFQCTPCPIGSYSSSFGSTLCAPCGAFATNIKEASINCPHFALNASAFSYYALGSFITVLFLSALLFAGENVYIMFFLCLFPLLDIVSDMIYILSVKFWNFELFISAIVFFIVPSSMFIYKLSRMKAYPKMIKFVGTSIMNDQYIWLSVSSDGSPLINDERCSFSYEEHDGIDKLAWYWILWVVLVSLQLAFIVLSIVWYAIAAAFLTVWLLIGLFLYQMKMLAIGKVWNSWFYSWTQSTDFNKEMSLDASVLNESLFHEFVLETIPQIAIQSINNSLIYNGNFPAISLFSLAMSIFIAINGVYRYGYYLLWKRIKFDEIPLPLAIRMQKINKSMLPRKSMITRKLKSLVNSAKVSDESAIHNASPSAIRRMSRVLRDKKVSPTDVKSSIMFNLQEMKVGLTRLQSMEGVEISDVERFTHFINELSNITTNSVKDGPSRATNKEAEVREASECSSNSDQADVAIDIVDNRQNFMNNNKKVMPYGVITEPSFKLTSKLNAIAPINYDSTIDPASKDTRVILTGTGLASYDSFDELSDSDNNTAVEQGAAADVVNSNDMMNKMDLTSYDNIFDELSDSDSNTAAEGDARTVAVIGNYNVNSNSVNIPVLDDEFDDLSDNDIDSII